MNSSEATQVPILTSVFTIPLVGISLAIGPVKRLGLGAIGLPVVLASSSTFYLHRYLSWPNSASSLLHRGLKAWPLEYICYEQLLSILSHQAETDSDILDPSLKNFHRARLCLLIFKEILYWGTIYNRGWDSFGKKPPGPNSSHICFQVSGSIRLLQLRGRKRLSLLLYLEQTR